MGVTGNVRVVEAGVDRAMRLATQAAYVFFIGVMIWFAFPQLHPAAGKLWRWHLWVWKVGRWERRADSLEPWQREALEVRGKIQPRKAP
jgi:hypothetical protein